MLCHSNENEENERRFLDVLSSQRADGIIAAPVGVHFEHYEQIVKVIPTVFLTRHFKRNGTNWVDMDNYGSSYNIMSHLLRNGNRKVAVLRHESRISSIIDRMEGMWDACRDFGIPRENIHLINTGIDIDDACKKVMDFLEEGTEITAIYSLYTMPALGAIKALTTTGRRVPDDVSVAAFNGMDDAQYRSLLATPLTGNLHPTEKMCKKAIDMLLHTIEIYEATGVMPDSEEALFPMDFVVEASSNYIRNI